MDTRKAIVGADSYDYYPNLWQYLPTLGISCFASAKTVVRGNNRGYGYFGFPVHELSVTVSLSGAPTVSHINELMFINDFLLNDYIVANSLFTSLERSVIPITQKAPVGADNYFYAFPSWLAGAPSLLTVELLLDCCDKFSSSSENVLSQIFEIDDLSVFTSEQNFFSGLSLYDSYSQNYELLTNYLFSISPHLSTFLSHTYGETISDVIKPTIRSENYYAFPSWLPLEHIYLQYFLDCKPIHESVFETTISNICRLDEEYSRLFETDVSFDVLFGDSFTNEFQLSTFESLLVPLDVYSFLSHAYKKGIIDVVKLSVYADNYYAYPSWAGPEAFTLLVETSLECKSHFRSIYEKIFSLPLALKTHYIFPTNILNIYLPLGLDPNVGNYLALAFHLPIEIYPFLRSIYDAYVIHNLSGDTFGSFIRDLNVPIKLYLDYISSALSEIRFSQILDSSLKVTLESMLETIVSASIKDQYSSERITKGTLTVATDAAFVPLIQMVYELSLTAPLLYSPLLTTIKKSKALVKYLTIDIKKFNIDISIETIEREDG